MHGNDDAWLNLTYYFRRSGRVDHIAARRYEQHINGADLVDLFGRQHMPEVAEMTQAQVVKLHDVDGVSPAIATAMRIVKRGNPGNQHTLYFIFPRTAQY